MWMKIQILAWVVGLSASSLAQPLTLLTPVTSKMRSGSEFRAVDSAGKIYGGTVIPRHVVNGDPEGVIRAGRKKQVILLGSTPLIAKIADDSVDGAIGGGKARFVALGASILFMAVVKGGEVHLKPGDKLEVEAGR